MSDLIERLAESLERDPLVHYFEAAFQRYPDLLMKDMTLEAIGPEPGEVEWTVGGHLRVGQLPRFGPG